MCGIVGATAQRDVSEILLDGLARLEYRGYDSAGIAVQSIDGGGLSRLRCKGKVAELRQAFSETPLSGNTGIAHTRWATHGVPSEANAHPHMASDRICIVHNGIIENYEEIRSELMDLGCEFESQADSETIAHLIDQHYGDGSSLYESVRKACDRLEGSYALAVIAHDDTSRIVAARGGCALVVGLGHDESFLASDLLALSKLTNRFIFLHDGEFVELTPDSVVIRDTSDNVVEREPESIEVDQLELSKQNFRHFMAKEIFEQPRVIRDTLEGRLGRRRIIEQSLGIDAPEILDDTKAVMIVGCGTAYYAGCIAKYWIEDLAGIPCRAEIASEFRYRNAVVPEGSLFLALSQSGETADTIAALKRAKEREFKHSMVLCNVANSTLARESELAILLHAGIEVSVASTKAFTAMLVNLFLLALLLGRRNGMTEQREHELVTEMRTLESIMQEAVALSDQTKRLAVDFVDKRHVLFLGRGPQYPIALEGALKMKELSYIHAEGYPAGELKHGPLALVDANMPVVAVAPSNELLEKLHSNLQEVRARGGRLYVFADEDAGFEDSDDLTVVRVPKVAPLLAPIVFVVPLQLLAYHVAVHKGTDVDQPRNLAKSVTVE